MPTTSPLFRITVFNSFTEAEPAWRRATNECACYGFQCFEWQSTVHATGGPSNRVQPCIVHVTDSDGKTLLLLPFGIVRRFGLSILVFHGGHVTDYNAPLVNPSFAAECTQAAFRSLWSMIFQYLPRIDIVWLRRIPETIEGAVNPLLYLNGATVSDRSWIASLPNTFAEFCRRRNKHFFSDSVRQRRRLAEIGPVAFEIVDNIVERRDTVRLMLEQKQRRLRETNASPMEPKDCAFYKAFATVSFQSGTPHVSRLRVGEQTVATHLGMLFRNRFYWLMPGYEGGRWARYSCGRLLMESVLRWCIDKGVDTFDLTIGDEDYKRFWADATFPVRELRFSRTAKGAAVLAGWRLRRAVLNENADERREAIALQGTATSTTAGASRVYEYGNHE